MDFKKIKLPDFLLADLYHDKLVELPKDAPSKKNIEKAMATPQQWFLGENKKKVVIVVKDEESVYLRDQWLQFLSNILGACKLNLGDAAIVNYTRTSYGYEELLNKLTPQYLLLFDITANEIQLPFTVPHYQVQSYNHCSILLAPALEKMLGNEPASMLEKSKLWLSLKKMFNV